MGDRDRELSSRARNIVTGKPTLGAEDGDFLPSCHQLYGIRAVITIEMKEKGIWWLLAGVGDI